MSRPLPENPSLDHLRRQAKALRDAGRAGDPDAFARLALARSDVVVTLSMAQLAIAREYGFASWPRLKAEVDARTLDLPERVQVFLTASVDGRTEQAARLLAGDRRLAGVDIRTAAVLGDAERVRELITHSPASATDSDGDRGWAPLLYVCHSRWHRIDPGRAAGMVAVARLLLDAGAEPDSNNGASARAGRYRSALYGAAGIANNPAITELLLDRGANPDDDESLYHSVYHRDHACLRLLLAHGAKVNGTNALAAATGADDVEGVRLLVAAGGDPGRTVTAPAPAGHLADRSVNPLVAAVADDTAAVVEVLLAAGADPGASTRDGISLVRLAVRRGKADVADLLLGHGAADDTTPVDHLLGACLRAETPSTDHTGLSDVDLATIVYAAGRAGVAAVGTMLDLGFPVDTRDEDGQTALHEAAYAGRTDVVALLLARGATVDPLDGRWHSTPLCFATVGSGERSDGDWLGTIRALLAAGASTKGVWVDGKPPSEEVAALLHTYGISGEDEPDEPQIPADPRAMAELAERLRMGLETADLARFGDLLHPEARWAGCANRGQVLDWYRALYDTGVRTRVDDVMIHGNVILLGLAVRGPDFPPQAGLVYQAFHARDGVIVDIRGYQDRAEALAAR
jgi:ankyrin repeat protein